MNKVYIIDKSTNITYYFVGVKEISPQKNTTITEYPIPEGGNIGDHSYRNPYSLNFSLISDGFDVLKKSYYVTLDGDIVNLSYTALKELLDNWLKNATQLEIQTVHDHFNNMVLNSISWRESDNSWSKFVPTLGFRETRIANVYTTEINALNVATGADYTTENSTGEDNGSEITSESVIGGTLASAAVGAGLGAAVGSIIPGVGTAIGAAVGGIAGAVIGFFKEIF